MFNRARHRRTFAGMPTATERPRPLRMFALLCVGILVVVWAGWKALQALGILNQVQRMRVELSVAAGDVNVSLEGGELRKASDAKLYADDRIVSNGGGRALLKFFDGSVASIEEVSDVTIEESQRGTKHSAITLVLKQGKIAVHVPDLRVFSGSIIRTIKTPSYTATLPVGTRAVFSAQGMHVADADGLGVTVTADGADEPAFIGEGQQLTLPATAVRGSLYAYRGTVDPAAVRLVTGLGSQVASLPTQPASTGALVPVEAGATQDALVLSSPVENQLITSSTVQVRGQAGPAIQRVRVNGHDVKLDPANGSFSQELSVTKGTTMSIVVEALDVRDVSVAEQQRTVRLQTQALLKPTFTAPATDGATYRTAKKKFEIRGTAPAGAAGIIVNDYRLQLFKEGDREWAYLANADLGNIVPGKNVFTVVAVDAEGTKSPAATMTILLEEGDEGLVTGGTAGSAASASSEPEQVDEATLPKNAPLAPGSLTVTAPTTGAAFTATESEILIEGNTAKDTDSVWVNGYKLRLYKPGATFWNYYARTQYGTLKKGKNVYIVNARNAKGEILDTLTYEIDY